MAPAAERTDRTLRVFEVMPLSEPYLPHLFAHLAPVLRLDGRHRLRGSTWNRGYVSKCERRELASRVAGVSVSIFAGSVITSEICRPNRACNAEREQRKGNEKRCAMHGCDSVRATSHHTHAVHAPACLVTSSSSKWCCQCLRFSGLQGRPVPSLRRSSV